MSRSITSLVKEKGKKGEKDFIVPQQASDHYLKLMSVKQTGNPQPPPSDFERTMSKESWREGTRVVLKCNVDEWATFCAQHNMTEEELLVIEYRD